MSVYNSVMKTILKWCQSPKEMSVEIVGKTRTHQGEETSLAGVKGGGLE